MKRWVIAASAPVLGAAVLAAAAMTAQAQIAPGGGPIDITADSLEVNEQQRVQIWKGRVEALQGQNRLRADSLMVYHAQRGGGGRSGTAPGPSMGDIERLEARGNVYFVSPTQVVRGDQAVYTQSTDTLVVTGDVILTQGENVLKGSRLVVNVGAGRATMDEGTGSRVRGVFYPEKKGG